MSAIEACGDPQYANSLLTDIVVALQAYLQAPQRMSSDSLQSVFDIANSAAAIARQNYPDGFVTPVGAKMATLLQISKRVFIGTIGSCSTLMGCFVDGERMMVQRFSSRQRHNYRPLLIDREGIFAKAPLGMIDPKTLQFEPLEFMFSSVGDFAAVTTFDMSRDDQRFERLMQRLFRTKKTVKRASMLLDSHQPTHEDALVGILTRTADANTGEDPEVEPL